MDLLDFTPTGLTPPVVRLIEAKDDPYAIEKEDPITRWEWLQKRKNFVQIHLHSVRSQATRLEKAINATHGLPSWESAVRTWKKAEGELLVEPSLRRNEKYQQTVGSDPRYERLIKLEIRAYEIQKVADAIDKMESTAEAAKTKAAKASMAARAEAEANAIVPPASRNVNIGVHSFNNPYFSVLSKKSAKAQKHLIRVAVPVYKFIFPKTHSQGYHLKYFDEVTRALDRSNKRWTYAYGYYVFNRTSVEKGQMSIPDYVGYVFRTADNSIAMTHREIYNPTRSMSVYDFTRLHSFQQDEFIAGL